MAHQYLIFRRGARGARLVRAGGPKAAASARLSMSPYYLRQEKNGFNLGPYGTGPARRIGPTTADPMPEDFSFQLYPDALDRLSGADLDNPRWSALPVLAEAGLAKVINGPIPYAPDGKTRCLGPMPGVPNAFEACVLHLRHRAGRRRGQGAGRVDHRRRDRMGTCGSCDPPPLHRFHRPRLIACRRGWRSTATNTPCIPLASLARRAGSQAVRRSMTGEGAWRPDGRLCRVGARQLVRAIRATDKPPSEAATQNLEPPHRPVGGAHPRGMRGGVRDSVGVLDPARASLRAFRPDGSQAPPTGFWARSRRRAAQARVG